MIMICRCFFRQIRVNAGGIRRIFQNVELSERPLIKAFFSRPLLGSGTAFIFLAVWCEKGQSIRKRLGAFTSNYSDL